MEAPQPVRVERRGKGGAGTAFTKGSSRTARGTCDYGALFCMIHRAKQTLIRRAHLQVQCCRSKGRVGAHKAELPKRRQASHLALALALAQVVHLHDPLPAVGVSATPRNHVAIPGRQQVA